ncbi:MAG: hypothetical protein AB1420_07315 [Bacillota bacterium]
MTEIRLSRLPKVIILVLIVLAANFFQAASGSTVHNAYSELEQLGLPVDSHVFLDVAIEAVPDSFMLNRYFKEGYEIGISASNDDNTYSPGVSNDSNKSSNPFADKKQPVTEDKQSPSGAGASRGTAGADQDLNKYVLDIINTYEIGKYPYLLNTDYQNYNGVTTDLKYKDQLLLKAHPSGSKASHCSGITFEVFFKAMQERNKQLGISLDNFNGMTWEELFDFVLLWYVADGVKKNSNVAVAVEKYGIGKRVKNLEDAKPGDFIDFSRENNTGHTVVFMNWIKKDGQIIGLRYWSSQESTKGINYKTEYFNIKDSNGRKYGNVIKDQLHIARVLPVKDYKGF